MDLFAPNNHSTSDIRWKEVEPDQLSTVIAVLKKHYHDAEPEEVVQIDSFEVRSNNFRITYNDSGARSRFILRKNIQHASNDALNAIGHILQELKKSGVPVPELVPAKDGSVAVNEEGDLWELYTFIPGTYYRGTPEELMQAATAIARLHRVLSTLESTVSPSPEWTVPTVAEFETLYASAHAGTSELDALVRENEKVLRDIVAEIASHGNDIQRAGIQLIHADLHPHNLLFDAGRLTAILDLGDVRVGFRAADAASACHRLVRQYIVTAGQGWQETLEGGLELFLSAYRQEFPLPAEELHLFPQFMTLALLRKIKGNLSKYYEGRPGWTHDVARKEFQKQMALLSEVQAIQQSAIWTR